MLMSVEIMQLFALEITQIGKNEKLTQDFECSPSEEYAPPSVERQASI